MGVVFDQVVDFVDTQYETYLDGEARVNRRPISDTRVHACLYFIAPSGHGLKVSIWKDILKLVYSSNGQPSAQGHFAAQWSIYRRFSIRSRNNQSLVIPNKTTFI